MELLRCVNVRGTGQRSPGNSAYSQITNPRDSCLPDTCLGRGGALW